MEVAQFNVLRSEMARLLPRENASHRHRLQAYSIYFESILMFGSVRVMGPVAGLIGIGEHVVVDSRPLVEDISSETSCGGVKVRPSETVRIPFRCSLQGGIQGPIRANGTRCNSTTFL